MGFWYRWAIVWFGCLTLGIWLLGCQSSSSEESIEEPIADLDELSLALESVASGLSLPLAVTHADDDRLFIVEQSGRVRIWRADGLLETPFLDIEPQVLSGGERGLFSVAFHPNYSVPDAPGEGMLWVNYTDLNGDTVIARYTVSTDDPDRADPESGLILLNIEQPFGNHNGGQLQFGPVEGLDGERYLYIGMGDGGSGGDPLNHAQRDDSLLGKMLRIDPSTKSEPTAPFYTVPPDNPRSSDLPPLDTVWAKGLRNPWRFSFDAVSGHLYIGDVGQSAFEEVHVTAAGAPSGLNYGWRLMEGFACFNPRENCGDGTLLILPAVAYQQRNGRCAIIGGYVYRGMRFPAFNGIYFYADHCTGEVFGFRFDASSDAPIEPMELYTHGQRILAFGEDANGELYLMDSAGDIFRIAAAE